MSPVFPIEPCGYTVDWYQELLTNPSEIKLYTFGSNVHMDWRIACRSECLIQVQEKALVAKFPKSIVERKIGTGSFIKQDAQSGSVPGPECMKERGAVKIITTLQVAKNNAAQEFIFEHRKT